MQVHHSNYRDFTDYLVKHDIWLRRPGLNSSYKATGRIVPSHYDPNDLVLETKKHRSGSTGRSTVYKPIRDVEKWEYYIEGVPGEKTLKSLVQRKGWCHPRAASSDKYRVSRPHPHGMMGATINPADVKLAAEIAKKTSSVYEIKDIAAAAKMTALHRAGKLSNSQMVSDPMGCNHKWEPYVGITEGYDYCIHCDTKKQ